MGIVFDQVEGVVQPQADAAVSPQVPNDAGPPQEWQLDDLQKQLERAARRRQRLLAE